MAVVSLGALSLVAQAPAALGDEMNAFDYLSPPRLAVKAMQQKMIELIEFLLTLLQKFGCVKTLVAIINGYKKLGQFGVIILIFMYG